MQVRCTRGAGEQCLGRRSDIRNDLAFIVIAGGGGIGFTSYYRDVVAYQ